MNEFKKDLEELTEFAPERNKEMKQLLVGGKEYDQEKCCVF